MNLMMRLLVWMLHVLKVTLGFIVTITRRGTQSSNSVREFSDPIPVDLLIQIPVELLSEIFFRVPSPTKSVGRFCCVSKLWRSTLRSPNFTELFLTKSSTRPRMLFSFRDKDELLFFSAPQPQNPDKDTSVVATRYHHKAFGFGYSCRTTHCGLVHLDVKKQVIYNPVTGESITLPSVTRRKRKMARESYFFGYDPINKQFKVLCMNKSDDGRPMTHKVLTMETGKQSSWRGIGKFHYEGNHYLFFSQICINGVLYFADSFQGSSMIVCFDIKSEKFDFININEDVLGDPIDPGPVLINYKCKLGVFQQYPNKFVLWSLEDARKNKWSKRICVLSTPGEERKVVHTIFVGITCTGEIVFRPLHMSNPFYLSYYNLERNTFTRVEIHGFEEYIDRREEYFKAGVPKISLDYVETLKFM